MAATIAYCKGYDKNRIKEEHRLGSEAAAAEVATWKTEVIAFIRKDGSGYVIVRNKATDELIHSYGFGPESERQG